MSRKEAVAKAALAEIQPDIVLGIGTGSTVDCLIDLMPTIECPGWVVSSSDRSTKRLRALGFEVRSLNDVGPLDVYIDGADQVLPSLVSLKGKGGAHTLEKLLASNSKRFVGMITEDKMVSLITDAIPVEVLPQARSSVSRALTAMDAIPVYREGYTDNHNVILDVHQLDIRDPIALEKNLRLITGVVDVGIFAVNRFDKLYIGGDKIKIIENLQ